MSNTFPLSVVISAFNEEKKITGCLESVNWADEIILIDNTSTDTTAAIAQKYTKHIYTLPNNLMLNVNKNIGFTKASHNWILSLDADERVSPELAKEIKSIVTSEENINGYFIPRKNIIFGKWIMHSGWYPDYVLRLFKKGQGKFEEKHVHEMVKVRGKTDYLKEHIDHLNYDSLAQFLHKTIVIYAPNEASQKIQQGYTFNYADAIRFPLDEFLSRFFAREGYKDGFHGLMLSFLMSFYHFIVFANIWEMQGYKDTEKSNILLETEKNFVRGYKEIMHWFYTEKIKNAKGNVEKTFFKIKRRIH